MSATTALVYGAAPGVGGLGIHAAATAVMLGHGGSVVCLGPAPAPGWRLQQPPQLRWEDFPRYQPSWWTRHVVRRLRPGRYVLDQDLHVARWAAAQLDRVRPERVFTFTQIGLETLQWARSHGVPSVVDNPNGHIRGQAELFRREWAKWAGGRYPGHPTEEMVRRVESEYELADWIRVSSFWSKETMVRRGVPADKVFVWPQTVDLTRFVPPPLRQSPAGPLRLCYVGSLDLRKGFLYLLQACRKFGAERVRLEVVGATGDRTSRRLLERERAGLEVTVSPGDPVPAYHRAELFVLPSLEDGFGLVVAEAMACGLPVVVTDQCGAAAWVKHGETGWIVPAGDSAALADVLRQAETRRPDLPEMGRAARAAVEQQHALLGPEKFLDLLPEIGRASRPVFSQVPPSA